MSKKKKKQTPQVAGAGFGHRDGAWNQGKVEDSRRERERQRARRARQSRDWERD